MSNALLDQPSMADDEHEPARQIKREPATGRIHHTRPFGGQTSTDDPSADDSQFQPNFGASQSQHDRSSVHEAWSSHPSIAGRARAPSVAFDSENQPDIKPILGWYDSNPGQEALKQLSTMQARLNQRLGPEYIAQRPGGGGAGKLHYLEGWKAIDLANDVFGFNGWSTTVRSLTTDFMDVSPDGRVNCGVTAIVRVSLRDGTFHEDVGYGHCENIKGKAPALEKAKKEAVTDALKRALRTFGRLVGNCVYDKKYLATVVKMTPVEQRYNPDEMHRRQDYSAPPPVSQLQSQSQSQPQAGPSTASRAPPSKESRPHDDQPQNPYPHPPPLHPNLQQRASTSPTKPSIPPDVVNGTSTSEEQERIRAERQALAAQRQAAFRQRQEEQKRGAAAALERQRAAASTTTVKVESTSPGISRSNSPVTSSSTFASTSANGTPVAAAPVRGPPARLKRAPPAPLPPSPPRQVSDDPASRLFAKEPGAKWSTAARQQSRPPQPPPSVPSEDNAAGDHDVSNETHVADEDGGGASKRRRT